MDFQHNQTFVGDQACVFTDAWKTLSVLQCSLAPESAKWRNYASQCSKKNKARQLTARQTRCHIIF